MFVLAVVVLIIIAVIIVYSGNYDVGASQPHSGFVATILNAAYEHSVRTQARSVSVPPDVNLHDPALAERAASDYNEMCRTCHGAPGQKPDEWMKGLYPPAPDLTDAGEKQWSDLEVFWIIKNGVKDTGMSAMGESHDDNELWALTALVRQFLTMTPEQYREMLARSQKEEKNKSGRTAQQ